MCPELTHGSMNPITYDVNNHILIVGGIYLFVYMFIKLHNYPKHGRGYQESANWTKYDQHYV